MKTDKKIQLKWIVCILLALLGAVGVFFLPGYRFGGLCLIGLASLIPISHFLKKYRRLYRMFRILVVVFFAAVIITGCIVVSASQGSADPQADYLIVLGAGVNGTQPSLSLRERLDAACDYLTAYPDAVAIVSGGQGNGEEISEAQCMYNYLTAAGIDPERVWMEDQATNTLQNLNFSLDLIESRTGQRPTHVAILSSEYHLYRVSIFAGWLDLEAELVPAATGWLSLRANYYLREIFAVWYYSLLGGSL